jgi:hypothetical protein
MNSYQGALDRLRSDIQINRADLLDKDKRLADQEDQLVQSKKEVMALCIYSRIIYPTHPVIYSPAVGEAALASVPAESAGLLK